MYKKLKTIIGVLIILFLLIGFHRLGWLGPVERGMTGILRLTTKPFYRIGLFFSDKKILKKEKKELFREIEDLKNELNDNKVDTVRLKLLEEENQEFRNQLFFFTSGDYNHIGAEVIGRTIDPLDTVIIIDKGQSHGIQKNMPVVVGKGILVGVIAEVHPQSSLVRLINDNESKIAASIVNIEKSIGLVEGGYGLGIQMNFIPQNEILNIGDTIITSGLTEGIPRGLVIGLVELIEKQPHEPFQTAVLNPTADLSHLNFVSIITGTFLAESKL